ELDPRRERLVGYLNDDVTLRRTTPWTLLQVFAAEEGHVLAVGPGGGLRRAALLAPPADGPWAAAPIAVASTVMWWLAGGQPLDPELPPGTELFDASQHHADIDVPSGTGARSIAVASGRDRLRRLEGVQDAL